MGTGHRTRRLCALIGCAAALAMPTHAPGSQAEATEALAAAGGVLRVYGRETTGITLGDFQLMAKTVYAEAKGECFEGKVAVAEVILNRAESPGFPDTPGAAIRQEGAFSSWADGSVQEAPLDDECMEAVQEALERRMLPGSVVFFREGRYHAFGTPYAKIGRHYFSAGE